MRGNSNLFIFFLILGCLRNYRSLLQKLTYNPFLTRNVISARRRLKSWFSSRISPASMTYRSAEHCSRATTGTWRPPRGSSSTCRSRVRTSKLPRDSDLCILIQKPQNLSGRSPDQTRMARSERAHRFRSPGPESSAGPSVG